MIKQNIILLTLFFFTLFRLNFCLKEFDIKNVSDWIQTDITSKDETEIKYFSDDYFRKYNSQTLQITKSKMVAILNGFLYYNEDLNSYQQSQKIVVYNSQGQEVTYKIFENFSLYYVQALSQTNVKGEFLQIVNLYATIYLTFYDENLNISRNINQSQLDNFDETYAYYEFVVSMGKDLMYIMTNIQSYSLDYHIRIYVLDLSDTQTITLLNKITYFKYETNFLFSFSLQTFSDNSAIAHFYNVNKNNKPILVQLKYNLQGNKESGYPLEINSPLSGLQRYYQHWTWYSFLHEDGENATFLANNLKNKLIIYTFNKNGQKICSSINDIQGYENQWYYYGIMGSQGWIYLENKNTLEGNFGLFDAKTCTLNLNNLKNTGLYNGLAGQLIDQINSKLLIFQFGNLKNKEQQDTYQVRLYVIGTYEGEELYEGEDVYEGEYIYEGEDIYEDIQEGEGEQEEQEKYI